jgi:hypothetical protein
MKNVQISLSISMGCTITSSFTLTPLFIRLQWYSPMKCTKYIYNMEAMSVHVNVLSLKLLHGLLWNLVLRVYSRHCQANVILIWHWSNETTTSQEVEIELSIFLKGGSCFIIMCITQNIELNKIHNFCFKQFARFRLLPKYMEIY